MGEGAAALAGAGERTRGAAGAGSHGPHVGDGDGWRTGGFAGEGEKRTEGKKGKKRGYLFSNHERCERRAR